MPDAELPNKHYGVGTWQDDQLLREEPANARDENHVHGDEGKQS